MDFSNPHFLNVRVSQERCNCYTHKGELLYQLDAEFLDGTPFRILRDSYGFHLAIGDLSTCPDPIPLKELEQIIQKEIQQRSVTFLVYNRHENNSLRRDL